MNASAATGRITASMADIFALQSKLPSGSPIAVYCHSAANAPQEALGSILADTVRVTRAIVDTGHVVVGVQSASTYGNNAAMTSVDAAVASAVSRFGASTAEGIVLYGTSMGSLLAQHYALDGTYAVRKMVLFLPVMDLYTAYADNYGGAQALIAAAWGVTAPDPLTAAADTLTRASTIGSRGIPVLINYASNDLNSTPAALWIARTGATAHDRGALGHTNAVIAASDMTEIANFVAP